MTPHRILLVEDSFLVAHSLARMLGDLHVEVVGPAPSVDAAMHLIQTQDYDAAVLDVNLGAQTVEPVAQFLLDHNVPFIFITGYSSPMLTNPAFSRLPRLNKPIDALTLRQTLNQLLAPPTPPP